MLLVWEAVWIFSSMKKSIMRLKSFVLDVLLRLNVLTMLSIMMMEVLELILIQRKETQ